MTKDNIQESKIKVVKTFKTFSLQMQLLLSLTEGKVIFHTVHSVGLHKILVFFVNTEGVPCKPLNVFVKVLAQILIKDCE